MAELMWSTSDRFRDNDGTGKHMARILCVRDGVVFLERWPMRGGRRLRFSLNESFFTSKGCGWKRCDR